MPGVGRAATLLSLGLQTAETLQRVSPSAALFGTIQVVRELSTHVRHGARTGSGLLRDETGHVVIKHDVLARGGTCMTRASQGSAAAKLTI